MLDGGPRVAQVTAEEPTRCLALASWDFERVLREEPGVALSRAEGGRRPPSRGDGGPPDLTTTPELTVAAPDRPTGEVTFLFTDIEGSTRLVRRSAPRRGGRCWRATARSSGRRWSPTAGSRTRSRATRSSPSSPTPRRRSRPSPTCSGRSQAEPWPDGAAIRVRMGLHTGEGELDAEGDVRRPRRPPRGARRRRRPRRPGAALRGDRVAGRRPPPAGPVRSGRSAPTGSRTCGRNGSRSS